MIDTESAGAVELWDEIKVSVAHDGGPSEERALRHPRIPHLAITMHNFGSFDVTHIATGIRAAGPYERCGSAALACVHLAMCADWSVGDSKAIVASLTDDPCGDPDCTITSKDEKRQMTKRELFRSVAGNRWHDEFPWEGEGPADIAARLLEQFPAATDSHA